MRWLVALFYVVLPAGLLAQGLPRTSERAIAWMENMLDRRWDTQTLGERVSMSISSETRVSHVLGGYANQRNPRTVLFLNPVVARMALSGRNATCAHELAHLLTWRFYSHTLREGLADYLALQLHPGAAVWPNRDGSGASPPVVAGVSERLGTTAAPPEALLQDQAFRESYYESSYRLVRHLIGVGGLPKFLLLHAERDPEAAFTYMYGENRLTLVAAALGR